MKKLIIPFIIAAALGVTLISIHAFGEKPKEIAEQVPDGCGSQQLPQCIGPVQAAMDACATSTTPRICTEWKLGFQPCHACVCPVANYLHRQLPLC